MWRPPRFAFRRKSFPVERIYLDTSLLRKRLRQFAVFGAEAAEWDFDFLAIFAFQHGGFVFQSDNGRFDFE